MEKVGRFYVQRAAYEEVFSAINRPRAVVTVRGARQTGKTSLIMGAYADVKKGNDGLRAAFVDFQGLADEDFQSLSTIWRAVASQIAAQVDLDWDETQWRLAAGHDRNFSGFLDRIVFKASDKPLLVCLDETERIFNSPLKTQFFASVRSFYGRGAFDASWKSVRWLISTSSEPSFMIEDLTQSPFNIGLRVELHTLTPDEVAKLAERHGLALEAGPLNEIVDYLGGQPYLTHLLIYHLVRQDRPREQLFDARTAGGGVFREHVHRYLFQFQKEEDLADAMRSIVSGAGCGDAKLAHRIESAGLARRDASGKVVPLCRLYAEFFKNELA